jgi:hypothetical protein
VLAPGVRTAGIAMGGPAIAVAGRASGAALSMDLRPITPTQTFVTLRASGRAQRGQRHRSERFALSLGSARRWTSAVRAEPLPTWVLACRSIYGDIRFPV